MRGSGGLAAVVLGGLLVFTGALHVEDVAARQAVSAAPEAPAPGYTPRFVTQTDERPPWEDCLWASGVMLLDKWTHGRLSPDRQVLRRASGDRIGGSRFADLARAISRLYGWRPHFSPDGGEKLTWNALLERLASGGGAILAGDYGRLGRPFTRWARAYANDPRAAGHALYVERYDARNKRIWLMDPLGHDGYSGEWVPASRVRSFVWKRNGFVYAMPTPGPPPRSVTGYVPDALTLDLGTHRAGELVPASIPLLETGPWKLPNLVLVSRWEMVGPDVPGAETAIASEANLKDKASLVGRSPLRLRTDKPPIAGAAPGDVTSAPLSSLQTWVAMPTAPGLYRLTATVERGDGRAMPKSWRLDPLELRVWGVRGAVVTPAPPIDATAAGQPFAVSISVENAGTTAWTYGESGPRVGDDTASAVTQLEVTWLDGDGKQWPAMAPLLLGSASAQVQQVTLSLTAPKLPGDYSLIFDVADGSGSLLGAEDLAHVLSLGVGPTPIESVDPTQNR